MNFHQHRNIKNIINNFSTSHWKKKKKIVHLFFHIVFLWKYTLATHMKMKLKENTGKIHRQNFFFILFLCFSFLLSVFSFFFSKIKNKSKLQLITHNNSSSEFPRNNRTSCESLSEISFYIIFFLLHMRIYFRNNFLTFFFIIFLFLTRTFSHFIAS